MRCSNVTGKAGLSGTFVPASGNETIGTVDAVR